MSVWNIAHFRHSVNAQTSKIVFSGDIRQRVYHASGMIYMVCNCKPHSLTKNTLVCILCHLQVGESVITDDCHRIHTCQASGVVLSRNMSCDPNEHCQVKNSTMGCFPQQCVLGLNGTLTAFNGESGTVTVPGSYELIQSCDQSQTSDWFRVVVKLETCIPGVNSVVAVYVFFNEVMITFNNKHDIWVSVRSTYDSNVAQKVDLLQ